MRFQKLRGFLLFDIDGVIRDVAGSYRLAIQKTVYHFTRWTPNLEAIDELKAEGCWNNDWDASMELIKRHQKSKFKSIELPSRANLIEIFSHFYFGGDPDGDPREWQGLIKNEPLLVKPSFFQALDNLDIAWGFVSGAEPASAKFVLQTRLSLKNPPLIAMGDAPDKPDPKGLILLLSRITQAPLGVKNPPVAYLGDTVADVLTIKKAREAIPGQEFISLAIVPPHLKGEAKKELRDDYENNLKKAGADHIISSIQDSIQIIEGWR